MRTKICTVCDLTLPWEDFPKNRRKCKKCRSKIMHERYIKKYIPHPKQIMTKEEAQIRKRHLQNKRNRLKKKTMKNEAPLCACGCKQKVEYDPTDRKFNKYIFNHHQCSFKQKNVKLTHRQKQIILGTLMGDGYIHAIKSRGTGYTGMARLKIGHSPKRQLEYAKWLYEELKNITTTDLKIRPNKGFSEFIASFATVTRKDLFQIWEKAYVIENNKLRKVVTLDYLNKLDPLGLAVWWMDDGYSGAISTHSFTLDEHSIMVKFMDNKYGIKMKISTETKKDGRKFNYLRFTRDSFRKFYAIIKSHIHPSLRYKLGKYYLEKS